MTICQKAGARREIMCSDRSMRGALAAKMVAQGRYIPSNSLLVLAEKACQNLRTAARMSTGETAFDADEEFGIF
jgi:hypothetical protein